MRDASLALRALAVVCVALGIFPLANALGANVVPWWELAVREWLIRGAVVLALCVGAAWTLGRSIDVLLANANALILRLPARTFGVVAAIVVGVLAALLAIWCFAGQPFTSDEMAQQWHARILLSGRLFAEAERYPEFFNTAPVFDRDGRWFSQYPIGASALIALGALVKAQWLVNPILLGLAAWWLYRFLSAQNDELAARWTVVLFGFSPMVLVMGASQMNHVPALTFALLALAALARWEEGKTPHRSAAVVGLAIGLVALARPLDAAIVAIVVGGYQLACAAREPRLRRSLLTQLAVGLIPIALLLWANHRTTGSAFLFGYDALNGPAHRLGFHIDPNGETHTMRRGLTYLSGYLMRLSRYLFEWPLPGLLFVAAGLALTKASRFGLLLAALAWGFMLAYAAYWFDGFFSGPRFLFTAAPAFLFFAARAPSGVAGRLKHPIARRATYLLVPLCVLVAWLGPTGESSARARVRSYHEQRTKLKTDVEAQVQRAGLRNALVFVNEGWRGSLLARLRVLGLSQFRAERVLNTTDACALQTELDGLRGGGASRAAAEQLVARARAYGEARLEPGLPADRAIALVRGSRPTPTCLGEFLRDSAGTMPYPIFLAKQHVGRDGRVGGDVVFARDLGIRNELLRPRFADRAWYVYVPGRSLEDTTPSFRPYVAARAGR